MPHDHVIPRHLLETAKIEGAAIIVTDYYMSRRLRVHFAYLVEVDEWFAEESLLDVYQWCLEHGRSTVYVVAGTRTRPRHYYKLRLSEHVPSFK